MPMIRQPNGQIGGSLPPLKGWERYVAPAVQTAITAGIAIVVIGWWGLLIAREIFYAPFVRRK